MKKTILLVGAIALLSGMGLNLQYALDDYELADNRMIALWADGTNTGDDGGGTGESGSVSDSQPCLDCNKSGGPGSTSCTCTSGSVVVGGNGGGGENCSVTVRDGYYACCRKDQQGLCNCPSCKE